jgi:hypothetical protein
MIVTALQTVEHSGDNHFCEWCSDVFRSKWNMEREVRNPFEGSSAEKKLLMPAVGIRRCAIRVWCRPMTFELNVQRKIETSTGIKPDRSGVLTVHRE